MVSFNPYFLIGSVGLVFTTFVHMLATAIADRINHAGFFILYLIFTIILFLGFGNTRRMEKVRVRRK